MKWPILYSLSYAFFISNVVEIFEIYFFIVKNGIEEFCKFSCLNHPTWPLVKYIDLMFITQFPESPYNPYLNEFIIIYTEEFTTKPISKNLRQT